MDAGLVAIRGVAAGWEVDWGTDFAALCALPPGRRIRGLRSTRPGEMVVFSMLRRTPFSSVPLLRMLVLVPSLVVLSGVLVYFAVLREDEVFWTNRGGYSVEFRELVLELFYPLYYLDAGLMLIWSCLLMFRSGKSATTFWVEAGLVAAFWGLDVLVGVLVIVN